MKISRILILTDYRGAFYSSTKNTKTLCTMDVEKICQGLISGGYNVEKQEFGRINLFEDYRSTAVLYTSSEDYGLFYRSYIEDVIFALKQKGALLIPDLTFLRAHHNKSYMEMLRKILLLEQAEILNTHIFGTYEEFENAKLPDGKYVVKEAYGAGSVGVALAKNYSELKKVVRKLSRNESLIVVLKEMKKRILWGKSYHNASIHNRKFIIQNYIEGLSGDYKVLKYGEKFYCLYRQNRENDFRASGGGKLTYNFPVELPREQLFTFAKNVSDQIGTPLCSMDIAWNGKTFILIEFQCLCFGPHTAEKSDSYYVCENDVWVKHDASCDLEMVFCEAIDDYLCEFNTQQDKSMHSAM